MEFVTCLIWEFWKFAFLKVAKGHHSSPCSNWHPMWEFEEFTFYRFIKRHPTCLAQNACTCGSPRNLYSWKSQKGILFCLTQNWCHMWKFWEFAFLKVVKGHPSLPCPKLKPHVGVRRICIPWTHKKTSNSSSPKYMHVGKSRKFCIFGILKKSSKFTLPKMHACAKVSKICILNILPKMHAYVKVLGILHSKSP
jgi:hypothetical protein